MEKKGEGRARGRKKGRGERKLKEAGRSNWRTVLLAATFMKHRKLKVYLK